MRALCSPAIGTRPCVSIVHACKANYSTKINFDTILLCRCGHCKQLAPEYESAATELSLASPPVPLAKVDATVETSLANRFGINGYPTLKVFHQGTPYDYEGPRTAQGQAPQLLMI